MLIHNHQWAVLHNESWGRTLTEIWWSKQLPVFNVYGMHHMENKNWLQRLLSWLPAVYFTCNFFHQMSRQMQDAATFMSPWFSLVEINTIDFGVSMQTLFAEIINVGMLVLLGMDLAWISDVFDVLGFCLYFGGFATMWLMGFSPTIYASAERPRFIGYYCLLCCLLVEMVHGGQKFWRANQYSNWRL